MELRKAVKSVILPSAFSPDSTTNQMRKCSTTLFVHVKFLSIFFHFLIKRYNILRFKSWLFWLRHCTVCFCHQHAHLQHCGSISLLHSPTVPRWLQSSSLNSRNYGLYRQLS